MVESKHEAAIHLDSIAMQDFDTPCVVVRARAFLVRGGDVFILQRFETDKHARTPRSAISRTSDGSSVTSIEMARAPNLFQRPKCPAKAKQVFGPRAEIVVDEHAVGLAIGAKYLDDLLDIAHEIRHMQTVGRQIAKAAAIVAPRVAIRLLVVRKRRRGRRSRRGGGSSRYGRR